MKKDSWIKSPLALGIIPAVVGSLIPIIHDYIKELPLGTTFILVSNYLIKTLTRVLSFEIKLWWVLSSAAAILVFIVILRRFSQPQTPPLPKFLNYTEGVLKNWKWSWKWKHTNSGWQITQLTAHCPKCTTTMIQYKTSFGPNFECPRCTYSASEYQCEMPHHIESLIIDNIDRNNFIAESY